MKNWLRKRPWIWIVIFFTSYVAAWSVLITVAVKHSPPAFEPIPAEKHES